MQLMRVGELGKEFPVIRVDNEKLVEVPASYGDLNTAFFADDGLRKLADDFAKNGSQFKTHKLTDVGRIGSSVVTPPNFYCMGLNYTNHIIEVSADRAAAEKAIEKIRREGPAIFFKATSSVCGPNDDIIIPPGSVKTDYEVEVGVVIGKRGYRISIDDAPTYVAGFVAVNDLSEREHQVEISSGQWSKGKSHPSFGPIGPFLVTTDQIANPNKMGMWLSVNGETRQDSNTSEMLHGLFDLVSYLSKYMELVPGDIISSGTPPGVGMGQKPNPVFLKPGDVVEMGVGGLGRRRQQVVAAAS